MTNIDESFLYSKKHLHDELISFGKLVLSQYFSLKFKFKYKLFSRIKRLKINIYHLNAFKRLSQGNKVTHNAVIRLANYRDVILI